MASLFTREFYQAAANALEDDGMLLQWVQAYEVDAETVRTIYATVASVFPVVETWHLKSDDLLLIASARPRQLDVSRLRSRLEGEPFRSAFARAWRTTELEGVLAHYVAGPGTAAAIADGEGGAINTDDRNRVEFGFARSLGGNTDFTVNDVRAMARSRNDGTPRTRGGDVDWRRADEHVITLLADEGLVISRPDAGQGAAIAHRIAALNAFSKADSARVLAEWRAQSEEPAGPTELAVVATALADAGNEAASGYIDAMRGFDAAEADVTLARLRFRQGRSEDAMRSLEAGFAAYRADPWPLPTVMLRALSVSVELIARNPALATRMWTALRTPFCMRLADEVRKKVAAFAAHLMAPGPACVEANEALEPNPVWTEEFLTSRAACYEQTAHPLAPRARNDIREFLRLAPTRFSLPPG